MNKEYLGELINPYTYKAPNFTFSPDYSDIENSNADSTGLTSEQKAGIIETSLKSATKLFSDIVGAASGAKQQERAYSHSLDMARAGYIPPGQQDIVPFLAIGIPAALIVGALIFSGKKR